MIQADTIVYEKSGVDACLAVLDGGQLREFEVFNENGAAEGNVYLGRIVKKVSLADDKTGFMVNVGDDKEAFMNAQERGLLEVNMTEGQCVVVQVSKEARADKGAKLVRAVQIAGTYLVYLPFGTFIDVSTKITDEEKARELHDAVMKNVSSQQEGWVVRTAAADADINAVIEEMAELRGIYENIRKAVHFLLSSNIGEIMTIFVAMCFGWATPLLPIQLLWVNLVTDSLPALALGSDPPQGDVMRRPPTARDSSAFSNGLGFAMAAEGMMIGALALLAFTVWRVLFDADAMQPAVGRT